MFVEFGNMKGTFNVNQATKIYRINLEGFAEPEATEKAVDGLELKLKNIQVSEWSIVIDCRKLSTFKPEILPIFERCQSNFTGKFVNTEEEMTNIINA
ncbi:hypothetical protein ACFVS2_22160 [Brevibacillus sp. NPDC058079]|uniref:hypothetical protein n=1 Tax=Brevibacillus sp. NPDC058079 TaxID=3346330 RepID=UPI0036ED0257